MTPNLEGEIQWETPGQAMRVWARPDVTGKTLTEGRFENVVMVVRRDVARAVGRGRI